MLAAMATNDELVRTFNELDENGDGQITASEFRVAMAARGETVTDVEIESIFRDADVDRDGRISLAEFTAAWNRAEPSS
jgi:Ca2+-binding EF-hand superfamily protein